MAFGGSGLEVEGELQLPAYTTATAIPDPSRICDLRHSSQQHWVLNPLNEARDRTCILRDASRVHHRWATTGILFGAVFLSGDIEERQSKHTFYAHLQINGPVVMDLLRTLSSQFSVKRKTEGIFLQSPHFFSY